MRVNWFLILACILASLWAWQQDTAFVEQNLVFSRNNLLAGHVWTIFTALFVHANPAHLFGNMLFLFVFGNTLEKRIGRKNHLTVFFTGGLTAFIGSLFFFPPDTGMLGASAAIFTLAAGVMLISPLKFSWLFLAPQGLVAIIYFAYNAIIVASPVLRNNFGYDPNVAYIAHIIGFLVGVPFGIAWSPQWKKNLLITLVLFGIYLVIITVLGLFIGLKTPFGIYQPASQ